MAVEDEVLVSEHPTEWVWMQHPNGAMARFPNDPDVIEVQQQKDWTLAEEPAAEDADSLPKSKAPDGALWVVMTNPETGAIIQVPNSEDVIADFHDRGWRQANKADQPPAAEPEAPVEEPKKRAAKKAATKPENEE